MCGLVIWGHELILIIVLGGCVVEISVYVFGFTELFSLCRLVGMN